MSESLPPSDPDQIPALDDKALEQLEQRLVPSPRKLAWLRVRFLLWRMSGTMGARIKRGIDISAAVCLLVLLLPLLLLVALLVKLTDGGPVLFWQMRVGKWG